MATAGSVIDLSLLALFNDTITFIDSRLEARNGGTDLLNSALTMFSNVTVNMTEPGASSVGTFELSAGSVLAGVGTIASNIMPHFAILPRFSAHF